MLSQIRRWGWLFNPITFFFVWDEADDGATARRPPVGAILEVTNTPWKERTRYPLVLDDSGDVLTAEFDKAMHVSPFLGMDYSYQIEIANRNDSIAVNLDVVDPGGLAVLQTNLRLGRRKATRRLLGEALRTQPFPTHRVSAGIHHQAARLWAKGVPLVAHPAKKPDAALASVSSTEESS